jgi:hypothetical protein
MDQAWPRDGQPSDGHNGTPGGRGVPINPLRASLSFARTRISPGRRRRIAIAAATYLVLLIYAFGLWIAHVINSSWSWGIDAVIAAAVAGPLALALLYDRINVLKTPWFEIGLADATVLVESALAEALDEKMLYASASPALIDALSQVLSPNAPKVIRVNLRSTPYWWSTRLYLLAALADDYTAVRRLAFVSGGAARVYVGLAEPRSVRTALAGRFPDYERAYAQLRARANGETQWQVARIVGNWQTDLAAGGVAGAPAGAGPDNPPAYEEAVKHLVTAEDLNDWLNGVLDTSSVTWNGWPQDRRLRATILAQHADYVAITGNGRLDSVVSRDALALAIARTTFKAE